MYWLKVPVTSDPCENEVTPWAWNTKLREALQIIGYNENNDMRRLYNKECYNSTRKTSSRRRVVADNKTIQEVAAFLSAIESTQSPEARQQGLEVLGILEDARRLSALKQSLLDIVNQRQEGGARTAQRNPYARTASMTSASASAKMGESYAPYSPRHPPIDDILTDKEGEVLTEFSATYSHNFRYINRNWEPPPSIDLYFASTLLSDVEYLMKQINLTATKYPEDAPLFEAYKNLYVSLENLKSIPMRPPPQDGGGGHPTTLQQYHAKYYPLYEQRYYGRP